VGTIEARRDACRCGYLCRCDACRKLFVNEASFAEAIASARGRQLTSPRVAEIAERIAAAP
jgi:hypothetical protein